MADDVKVKINTRAAQDIVRSALGKLQGVEKSTLLKRIGSQIRGNTRRRFEREVAPDGSPWKQLSPKTKRGKTNSKILQDSRDLFKSIQFALRGDAVEIGTPLFYGRFHQLGLGVPKREFIGLDSKDESDILAIVQDHISEGLR